MTVSEQSVSLEQKQHHRRKMLTSQLRELEYNNIVHREIYHQVPPKVEYSMSEYGEGLKPLLVSMRSWGYDHLKHLENLYGKDKEALIGE